MRLNLVLSSDVDRQSVGRRVADATTGDKTLPTLQYELERLTNSSLLLDENGFPGITGPLLGRLASLVRSDAPADDPRRSQLQADIDISRQFLDLCKQVKEVLPPKDHGSDQDMVKKEDSSVQLVGPGTMTPDGDGDLVVVTSVDV